MAWVLNRGNAIAITNTVCSVFFVCVARLSRSCGTPPVPTPICLNAPFPLSCSPSQSSFWTTQVNWCKWTDCQVATRWVHSSLYIWECDEDYFVVAATLMQPVRLLVSPTHSLWPVHGIYTISVTHTSPHTQPPHDYTLLTAMCAAAYTRLLHALHFFFFFMEAVTMLWW